MATSSFIANRHIGSILLIAFLFFLAIAKEFLVPLVLATLLSVLLTPIVVWLVRRKIPNIIAVGVVVGSLTVMTVLIGTLIFGQLNQVVDKIVDYRENIHSRLSELWTHDGTMAKAASTIQVLSKEFGAMEKTVVAERMGVPGEPAATVVDPLLHESLTGKKSAPPHSSSAHDKIEEGKEVLDSPPMKVEVMSDRRAGIGDLMPFLTTSFKPLAIAGLTLLLATFMIVQRNDLQRRFSILSKWMSKRGMSTIENEALEDITSRISTYLLLQTAINLCSGILIAGVLYVLGLPNALLWGLIMTLLRFIPYIGAVVACVITALFAVAVSPNWSLPGQVLILFIVVELIIGNAVEPLVLGHGTGLSSLGILVATAFWTWIWGPVGLFLAIPLTVCLVAVGRQVSSLGYLDILLAELPELPVKKGPERSVSDMVTEG